MAASTAPALQALHRPALAGLLAWTTPVAASSTCYPPLLQTAPAIRGHCTAVGVTGAIICFSCCLLYLPAGVTNSSCATCPALLPASLLGSSALAAAAAAICCSSVSFAATRCSNGVRCVLTGWFSRYLHGQQPHQRGDVIQVHMQSTCGAVETHGKLCLNMLTCTELLQVWL